MKLIEYTGRQNRRREIILDAIMARTDVQCMSCARRESFQREVALELPSIDGIAKSDTRFEQPELCGTMSI